MQYLHHVIPASDATDGMMANHAEKDDGDTASPLDWAKYR
jgi:hypothetical protein